MNYKKKYKELKRAVRKMHKADLDYGCGFYSDKTWLKWYLKTADLVDRGYMEIVDDAS